MAFVSLIHWHAIGTLEQATKDNDHAIQAVATTLRAIWLHQRLRYSMTPVGLKPNPITLAASNLVGGQLRTSWLNGIWLLQYRQFITSRTLVGQWEWTPTFHYPGVT